MLLAQRGYQVHVYERRGDPTAAAAVSSRTYPMSISMRSVNAIRAAGASPALLQRPPSQGFYRNGKALFTATDKTQTWVTDRTSLARDLVAEAKRVYPDAITFHFHHAFKAVDLDARLATFQPVTSTTPQAPPSMTDTPTPQGHHAPTLEPPDVTQGYDLLVAADGANSAVRDALLRLLPAGQLNLEVPYSANNNLYKTFHGLDVSLIPPEGAAGLMQGMASHAPYQYIYAANSSLPTGPGLVFWSPEPGRLSGMLTRLSSYEANALHQTLTQTFPTFPLPWIDAIVAQCSDASGQEPAQFGQVVRMSAFHAPRCVLVGDSAHAVTSTMGQGCNTALESARMLGEVLDHARHDLDAAPGLFTAARRSDVWALQHLEMCYAAFSVPTAAFPWYFKLYARVLLLTSFAVGALLNRTMPSRFPLPSTLFCALQGDGRVPFRRALASLWGQVAAVAVVLSTMAAVAALAFLWSLFFRRAG